MGEPVFHPNRSITGPQAPRLLDRVVEPFVPDLTEIAHHLIDLFLERFATANLVECYIRAATNTELFEPLVVQNEVNQTLSDLREWHDVRS